MITIKENENANYYISMILINAFFAIIFLLFIFLKFKTIDISGVILAFLYFLTFFLNIKKSYLLLKKQNNMLIYH